jgi:hypothetical protein
MQGTRLVGTPSSCLGFPDLDLAQRPPVLSLCGLSSFSHLVTGVNVTVHECDLSSTFPVLLVDAVWPALRVASLNKP